MTKLFDATAELISVVLLLGAGAYLIGFGTLV